MRIPRKSTALCAALSASMMAAAGAEVQTPVQSQLPSYQARVELVSLDVDVHDRQGNKVTGLQQGDFLVKENGVTMELTHFAEWSDRPVSLALVLDTSAIPRHKLVTAKQILTRLAHVLGREDELCLYTFNERDVYLEQSWTQDRIPLLEALRNIDVATGKATAFLKSLGGSAPRTGLAIDMALLELRRATKPKRALLVVSNQFRDLGPATVEHVQAAGYTLLTVGFGNKTSWLVSLGGDAISRSQLETQSGGRRFSGQTEDITLTSKAIADTLKNHYSVAYLADTTKNPKKMRRIRVTIPGHDYVIAHRRSRLPQPAR
jgi:VWFA-related protein